MNLVKQALGHLYEIQHEIGHGGMATVYKAIQKSQNRMVALKVVHQNLLHDTEFLERFHREAQLCIKLNHPNIVRVYEEGVLHGVHYMVMEYLDGTDLHKMIRKYNHFNPKQTLQLLLPIAQALDYAHSKGYIHRDIKSANIFVTVSGRVVLMDFGIAHARTGGQLTRVGTIIGTPEYMSPEQAEGKKVDHRTDLYSLGVVMYECLMGKVPLAGDNIISTIYKVINHQADVTGIKKLSAQVHQLVKALLNKNPDHRPPDAISVAKAIHKIISGMSQTDIRFKNNKHSKIIHKGRLHPHSQLNSKTTNWHERMTPAVWVLITIGTILFIILVVVIVSDNQKKTNAFHLKHIADETNIATDQQLTEKPGGIAHADINQSATNQSADRRPEDIRVSDLVHPCQCISDAIIIVDEIILTFQRAGGDWTDDHEGRLLQLFDIFDELEGHCFRNFNEHEFEECYNYQQLIRKIDILNEIL